jgi:hypothetical protein
LAVNVSVLPGQIPLAPLDVVMLAATPTGLTVTMVFSEVAEQPAPLNTFTL